MSEGERFVDTCRGPIAVRNASQARWVRIISTPEHVRLTKERWDQIRAEHRECAYCGDTPEHATMDHVQPLSRGGLHTEDNVVVACARCNSDKGNRTAEEYMQPYWWREETE